jgi:hypothetical protein
MTPSNVALCSLYCTTIGTQADQRLQQGHADEGKDEGRDDDGDEDGYGDEDEHESASTCDGSLPIVL